MKPTITLAEGGDTLEATIAYTRVFTATSYVAELIDANVADSSVTDTLVVADTEAGPWTRKLTVPAKGTYSFKVGWARNQGLLLHAPHTAMHTHTAAPPPCLRSSPPQTRTAPTALWPSRRQWCWACPTLPSWRLAPKASTPALAGSASPGVHPRPTPSSEPSELGPGQAFQQACMLPGAPGHHRPSAGMPVACLAAPPPANLPRLARLTCCVPLHHALATQVHPQPVPPRQHDGAGVHLRPVGCR